MTLTPSCRQNSVTLRFAFRCRCELSSPPVDPRLVVRSQSCPSHGDSPGTASDAVRGQTTMPGDDSPGAASRAVRGQATTPGKDGSAERIHMGGIDPAPG